MYKWLLTTIALLTSLTAQATELAPWYPRNLELQPKLTYLFQGYNSVRKGYHTEPFHSYNKFLTGSLGAALLCNLAAEIETTVARTRGKGLHFDNLRMTVRYQLLDDVVGDPLSVVVGLTGTQVFHRARHDVGSLHHGGIEGALHLAFGKECSCEEFWMNRVWGLVGVGCGDIGSAWLFGHLAAEKNCFDRHQVGVFLDWIAGLGHRTLHPHHFGGYGPVAHRSIDLGLEYKFRLECDGIITLAFAHRIFARNYPNNANSYVVSFLYPFGL